MCQINFRDYIAEKTIEGFKIVEKIKPGVFQSQFKPGSRSCIWENDRGSVIEYKVGESVSSPSGPGIMLYLNRPRAFEVNPNEALLQVRVPVGTRYHKGVNRGMERPEIIAADRIEVLSVIDAQAREEVVYTA